MKFRPCIDIHNGNVKQIVGGSLSDKNNYAVDNFVSEYDGAYYGKLYKSYGLTGGHIIILNPVGSEFYNADLEQAYSALSAFEGGLQIGGGINDENAAKFLEKGASHVIVTSFVFKNGVVNFDNLNRLVKSVGKSRLVLDLSCRKRDGKYYVVTDRWQKFTDIEMNSQTLEMFSEYCDEFLIHAVDTEGKAKGIEPQIAKIMGEYCTIPSTYAGGISSFDDLDTLKELGRGKIDFTIGSALDIFGGNMSFEKVAVYGK
jgi:phosphoribosylformimino-5-aminoimidazole carboxamide ribotide isomerase